MIWVIEVKNGYKWRFCMFDGEVLSYATRDEGRDDMYALKKNPIDEGDKYRLVPYERRER